MICFYSFPIRLNSLTCFNRCMPWEPPFINTTIQKCYASVEEIKAVSLSLLRRCLPDILRSMQCVGGGDNNEDTINKTMNNITFKLDVKRRLCTHLTRDGIIEAVTPLILGGGEGGGKLLPRCTFSVNLSDPDFSIRIEICKTLCGISVLPRDDWSGNFNLAEINDPTTKKTK